ncbi:MAG: UDP-N-acetylmuramate dehydrogenase [Patescibacteria group bacterium]
MGNNIFESLKKELPDIKKGILLSDHTTFKIGGPAEYFLIATKEKEIMHAIKTAKRLKIPIFVMGGGSNLLVSDNVIKGLVVKNQVIEPIVLIKNNIIEAPAGIVFGKLVNFSINKSLEGLEWAGGLPGTFGGAIRGNAGAFGGEIKDSVLKVRALDNKFNLKKLSNAQCKFAYRSSMFKQENWVVLSASVKLIKGDKKKIKEISNSHINYRREKHPLEYPNAGSIFKNVDFKEIPTKFQKLFLDKVKKDPFPIVPSAWFIIGAGLVGKKIGGAQISEKHSNYIVNLGGAKALDVLKLIDIVKQKVKKKYNIKLETEIQFIGF